MRKWLLHEFSLRSFLILLGLLVLYLGHETVFLVTFRTVVEPIHNYSEMHTIFEENAPIKIVYNPTLPNGQTSADDVENLMQLIETAQNVFGEKHIIEVVKFEEKLESKEVREILS